MPHTKLTNGPKERIFTDTEEVLIDITNPNELIAAMRFKARNIKAKAAPKLFDAVADELAKNKKTTSNWVKHNIAAVEAVGCDTKTIIIELLVSPDVTDVTKAIRNACTEYCKTNEGKKTFEGNCNCFNWGDFDTYVPSDILKRHGIIKLDSTPSTEVIFDEMLVDEFDIFEEE